MEDSKKWWDWHLSSAVTKESSVGLHSSASIDESHWRSNSPAISFIKFNFELHVGDPTDSFSIICRAKESIVSDKHYHMGKNNLIKHCKQKPCHKIVKLKSLFGGTCLVTAEPGSSSTEADANSSPYLLTKKPCKRYNSGKSTLLAATKIRLDSASLIS